MKNFGTICFMIFLIITFVAVYTLAGKILLNPEIQEITEIEKELIIPLKHK